MIIHDGDRVAVCYDGKISRAVEGRVIRVGPDSIRVAFMPWADEKAGMVELKFRYNKYRDYFYGYLKGRGEAGIMRAWFGTVGDYYSVFPIQYVLDLDYRVASYERPANVEGY